MKKKISKKHIYNKKVTKKVLSEEEEVELLDKLTEEQAPPSGTQPANSSDISFESMPLSTRTKEGLRSSKLVAPTDIQAATLPHALAGRDILGAAKTGSGKTLAFVIPMLEKLFRERWAPSDGLAALIITPTRELALQIFEVLRVVGRKHQISAGLITGGKKGLEEEQDRVVGMNVLVATPGRLLQHLEQTPGFDASQLQVLVLDEADRILDMGFKDQLDGIMTYLPPGGQRQTMLFSATQTKSVKDLARLSLHRPEYLAVHATHSEATPSQLVQNYVVCRLHEKLDVLYSFIKSHLKNKIVVFLSSCSQVRYVFECLRGLQPGIPLMALHGKIKQEKRTHIYLDYARKPAACLFATDIAARGLDFPDLDWVVQVDAPEDRAMYIHRVGRTARYTSGGRALLLLMPQEEKVVMEELTKSNGNSTKSDSVNNIPLKKLSLNPKRAVQVSNRAAAMNVANPQYKTLAQKAFVSYIKSLKLLSHRKHVYQWTQEELDSYAKSLGLHQTPEIPSLSDAASADISEAKAKKNVNRALDKLKSQIKAAKEEKKKLRDAKVGGKKSIENQDIEDDEDELLIVKGEAPDVYQLQKDKAAVNMSSDAVMASIKATKRKKDRPLKIDKDGETKKKSSRMVFDDDGTLVDPLASLSKSFTLEGEKKATGDVLSSSITARMLEAKSKLDNLRKEDDLREKERLKEKRLKMKRKRATDEVDTDSGVVCTLENTQIEDSSSDIGGGSEDNESSESYDSDDQIAKTNIVKGFNKSKMSNEYTSSSNSDDEETDDCDDEPNAKKRKQLTSAELRANEALVLKMMK